MRFLDFPALPSLDVYARRRLLIIALTLTFAGVVFLAINGASTSGGSPDPRELVPADALSYAEVHLDPAREQSAEADAFAARLPVISRQVVARATTSLPFAGLGIDPRERWLGDEAAWAMLPQGGGLELLASTDDLAALRFAGAYLGSPAKSTYRGVEILTGKRGSAATLGGFLVIGNDDAVRRAIDTSAGAPSLADYRPARSVLSALPSPSFARAYIAPGVGDGLGKALGPLKGPAALALRFTPRSLELDAHVRSAPAQLEGFHPTLPGTLAAGTLGYLGSGPLTGSARAALAGFGHSLPQLVSATLRQFGISHPAALAHELAPVLGGESAIAIVPGPKPGQAPFAAPTIGVVSKGVAAAAALHALHHLRHDVTGEVRGNRLLLAGNQSTLRRLVGHGDSLASTPAFRSATAGLARNPALEAYLDLSGLVPLFDSAGLAENPAYASFAPEARRLDGLGASLQPSKKALDARFRLTITGK